MSSDCLFFTAENRLKHDAESYRYKNIINDRAVIVSGLIGFCDQDSPYRGMPAYRVFLNSVDISNFSSMSDLINC